MNHPDNSRVPVQQPRIADMIAPARMELGCRITSKKRLMEHIAALLCHDSHMESQDVFRVLVERERLGSTGVGDGVALPHGRVADIDDAVLSLAVLDHPLDYQAPDNRDVQIVVGLLVPAHANDAHLQILARLARILSRAELRVRLLEAKTTNDVTSALQEVETQ